MGAFGPEAGWSEGLDHQPDPAKYTDFRKHVDAIHRHGMTFVLWVSPTYLYAPSKARFPGKLMGARDATGKVADPRKAVVDPRYPDVRDYLIETYLGIVRDYDVDGFFLDFLECFGVPGADDPTDDSRDYLSVSEADDQWDLLQSACRRVRRCARHVRRNGDLLHRRTGEQRAR